MSVFRAHPDTQSKVSPSCQSPYRILFFSFITLNTSIIMQLHTCNGLFLGLFSLLNPLQGQGPYPLSLPPVPCHSNQYIIKQLVYSLLNRFAFILQLPPHFPEVPILRSRVSTTIIYVLNPGPVLRTVFKVTILEAHFQAEVTKVRNITLYAQTYSF